MLRTAETTYCPAATAVAAAGVGDQVYYCCTTVVQQWLCCDKIRSQLTGNEKNPEERDGDHVTSMSNPTPAAYRVLVYRIQDSFPLRPLFFAAS